MAQYISNFNPLSVAGCVLWVDATDLNIGVVSDGSVKDKSGTNATLTTSGNVWTVTDAQEPFVGKKVFRNTSAGLSSEYLAASTGTTQPINTISATSTIYAVYSVCDKLSGTFSGTSTLFGSYGRVNLYINDTTTKRSINNNNTSYDNISCSRSAGSLSVLATTMTLYAPISEAAGGNSGVQVVTSGLGTNNITQNPGANIWGVFGNPFVIGNNWSVATSQSWVGCIAEILIYKSQLSAVEKLKIDGYLAAKWGAPLPATHPYYRATFTQTPPPFLRPFNPVEVSTPMMFWFDASDASTVTLSGATKWLDKSGKGNNISTFTDTVTYDAVNKMLTFPEGCTGDTPAISLTSGTSYSGFAVITWPPLPHDGTGVYLRPITTSTAVSATAGLGFGVNRMWYGSPYSAYTPASINSLGFGQTLTIYPKITFDANNAIPFATAYTLAPAIPGISDLSKEVVGSRIPPANSISTIGQVAQTTSTGLVVSGLPTANDFRLSAVNTSSELATGSNLVFTRNLPYFTDIDPLASTTTHTIGNISQGGKAINTFAWAPNGVSADSDYVVINPAAGTKLVVYWERTSSIAAGSSVNGNYVSVVTPSRNASTSSTIYKIGNPVSFNGTAGQLITGRAYNLHEVMMFDGVLSAPDRQKMESHLIWKWGAQRDTKTGVTTFPTTSPYYNYIPDTVTPYNPAAKLNGTTSTLALWFDAAEPASIVQGAGFLTRWKNKAQSFSNIQKDQVSSVPGGFNITYTPSSKNGLPALDLSSRGVNYMISEAATNNCFTTSGFTNQLSVFIVMSQATKPTSTTANIYDIFSTFPTVGNFRMFFTSGSRFSPTLNSYTQGAYPPEPSWGVNAFNIYEVTYNPASGWLYSYINGQGETGASLINLYGTALTESQKFRLFPGSGLDGKLCEVLVFNETLNTQDRQRVEGYLATKWDLQSLLPTGHPYYKVKI